MQWVLASQGFPGAQMVKNPTTVQETWVQSLCWEDSLEEGLTTYSSILAWRIPWTEETGGLQSVESQRAGHNWATFTHFTLGSSGKEPSCQSRRCKRCEFDPWARKMPWRRAWQLTPVFLPGESHGQRSLTSYSPWGHNWSDLACMHTGGEFEKSFSWHAVLRECTWEEIPYMCVCVCVCVYVHQCGSASFRAFISSSTRVLISEKAYTEFEKMFHYITLSVSTGETCPVKIGTVSIWVSDLIMYQIIPFFFPLPSFREKAAWQKHWKKYWTEKILRPLRRIIANCLLMSVSLPKKRVRISLNQDSRFYLSWRKWSAMEIPQSVSPAHIAWPLLLSFRYFTQHQACHFFTVTLSSVSFGHAHSMWDQGSIPCSGSKES